LIFVEYCSSSEVGTGINKSIQEIKIMNNNTTERAGFLFNTAGAKLSNLENLEWPTLEAPDSFSAALMQLWDAPVNTRRFAAPLPARGSTRRGFVATSAGLSRGR
jgi:hypothetical protein